MALENRVAIIERPISDRDFELLLRRASKCVKAGRLNLLKKMQKKIGTAALALPKKPVREGRGG
jgi:hypothetical protein